MPLWNLEKSHGPGFRGLPQLAQPSHAPPSDAFCPHTLSAPPAVHAPVQRRSWHQYCKRMAKTAVGAGRWVRRLQEFTLQPQQGAPLSGMSAHATQSLEVRVGLAAGGNERAGLRWFGPKQRAVSALLC